MVSCERKQGAGEGRASAEAKPKKIYSSKVNFHESVFSSRFGNKQKAFLASVLDLLLLPLLLLGALQQDAHQRRHDQARRLLALPMLAPV